METLDSNTRSAAQQSDAFYQFSVSPPFGINSRVPRRVDIAPLAQRADAVETLWNMLGDPQTSVVALTGDADAGKSTLAAMVYLRFQDDRQRGLSTPQHLVWLTPGPYAAITDVIAAILGALTQRESAPAFFHLPVEQQMNLLLLTLQRESAFVVIDQFDALFGAASPHAIVGYDHALTFLDTLQTSLGPSRILLTMQRLPEGLMRFAEGHVRALLVSRASMQEGVALLAQLGVPGSTDELTRVWQRCDGRVFALVLFSVLVSLSGAPPDYLVHAPDYQNLTGSAYTCQLAAEVCNRLNSTQHLLLQTLCLFSEPASLREIATVSMRRQARLTLSECQQEIAVLAQLSLVQQLVDEQGTPRYMLHSLLRHYMIDHFRSESSQYAAISSSSLGVATPLSPEMKEREAQQAALTVHLHIAGYYKSLAQKRCPSREQRSSLRDIEPLLMAMRHLCLGRQWQRAYDYFSQEGLYDSLMQWERLDILIALLRNLLPPFGMVQLPDESLVANLIGSLFAQRGSSQQSIEWHQKALTIQLQINNWRGSVETLITLGELYRATGIQQRARRSFEEALALSVKTPDALSECIIQHNLGILCQAASEYRQALNYYQAALKLAHSLQDSLREGLILTNIALLFYEQAQYAEALTVMRHAVSLRASLHDQSLSAIYPFYTMLEQNFAANVSLQQTRVETPSVGIVRQSSAQHTTDDYDASRFAALETVKHAAIIPPQGNRQQGKDSEAMHRLQQSFLETQRHAAVMPSRGSAKKSPKQPVRKTKAREDKEVEFGANGRLGTTSLWTNGTF